MLTTISSYLSNPLMQAESASTASTKALEDATKSRRAFEITERDKEKTPPANSAGSAANGSHTANTLLQAQSIAQQFMEFMDKSPDEMMREAILKELGYTEEDVAAMDTQDRLELEEKIRRLIQEKIEESMREKGVDLNLSSAALPLDPLS